MLDAALAAAIHGADDHHGHVRQTEILSDLLEGHYDSVITVAEAFADAVLGLGVAAAADGEIVALDGQVWRVPADGHPVLAEPDLGLPFAVVASGGVCVTENVPAGSDFRGITALVDELLASSGSAHGLSVAAVRVDGEFRDALFRSEPRQTPPYRPLKDVLDQEVTFAFARWTGSLVGFRFPDVENGEVIPGLHLHGVSADRRSGGHCHRATAARARLRVWFEDVQIVVERVSHPPAPTT